LIDAAEAPDEVAAVLAHEIGHVANRDPTRGALRSAGSIGVLGLLFGDFAGGTAVLFLANRLIDATYSQSAEAGADEFAYNVLANSGIPPSSLATIFERLRKKYGDSEGIVAHFAAHPSLGNRIEAAKAADANISADIRPSLEIEDWKALQGICN
jgi:predicted Zn-dependent protease